MALNMVHRDPKFEQFDDGFFEGRIPLAIRLVIRAVNMEILMNTRFALLSLFFFGRGA